MPRRIALSIGFIATGISVVIGIIIGGLMGYYAGLLDLLGMRFIEIFEAIPRLFLLITVTAFVQQRNIYLMMTVIGADRLDRLCPVPARRSSSPLRKLDYVQAAIAAGLPRRSILFRHMLPNGLTPILVNTTFGVARRILYESVLSFLGLGLVDEASWGGAAQSGACRRHRVHLVDRDLSRPDDFSDRLLLQPGRRSHPRRPGPQAAQAGLRESHDPTRQSHLRRCWKFRT